MENKKLVGAIIILLIAGAGIVWIVRDSMRSAPQGAPPSIPAQETPPYNTTYLIDGKPVTLVKGKAEEAAAPGSAERIIWEVVEQPVSGQLNGDDKWDAAMLLRRSGTGSGVFYYVIAALFAPEGPQTTEGFLLGDRIVPQSLIVDKGHIMVTYLTRAEGESFTDAPSLPVTKMLMVSGKTLTEIQGGH